MNKKTLNSCKSSVLISKIDLGEDFFAVGLYKKVWRFGSVFIFLLRMKFYRQKNFPNILGNGEKNETIARYGCFLVCLANLADMNPLDANEALKNGGGFVGSLIGDKKLVIDILGLSGSGETSSVRPSEICICETMIGTSTHFFIFDPKNGMINDPLSKVEGWEKNKYSIKNYRYIFEKKEEVDERQKEIDEKIRKAVSSQCSALWYSSSTDLRGKLEEIKKMVE